MKLLRDILILAAALLISALYSSTTASGSTLFIGDSLAVGTAPFIHVKHMKVNARVGRPLREGIALIKHYAPADDLLISLGSNDSPAILPDVKRAVAYSLRHARCVVWSTLHVRSRNYSQINRWLRRRESKRFRVVRWAHLVDRRPELLVDGVHPTRHGYYLRSRLYVKEMNQCP